MLTLVGEYTPECLAIDVAGLLKSDDVLERLSWLFATRGVPDHMRSDNGPEFTANEVRDWLKRVGVKKLFIEPGSLWENGYVESFTGKLSDELLDGEIFYALMEAKVLIERWRVHYNTVRPHSSPGYQPPAPEAWQIAPPLAGWTNKETGPNCADIQLRSPTVLENLSLGRYGAFVEFTIHIWIQMRWSSNPGRVRPDTRPDGAGKIGVEWEDASYDWLGDTYSSHANNRFWKLHGLINRRVDFWADVHGIQSIDWTGTWIGKLPPSPAPGPFDSIAHRNVFAALDEMVAGMTDSVESPGDHHHHGAAPLREMEAIANLIQDCGVAYHFYDRLAPELFTV